MKLAARRLALIATNLFTPSRSYPSHRTTMTNCESLLDTIAAHGPIYSVDATKIRVLRDPSEFYDELKTNIATAERRILLASLYLGTGFRERELVDSIARRLEESPTTRVDVLLDCIRGSRASGGGGSGEKATMTENSRTLLEPLLRRRPDRVTVSLYHTPNMLRIVKRLLPNKFKETLGLQHMKALVFDDTLLLTGANLSEDYFTNRQDRYIVVSDAPRLADFCARIVDVVAAHSYRLQTDGTLAMDSEIADPLAFLSKDAYRQSMNDSICDVVESEVAATRGVPKTSDTWICPLVQMGLYDVRHDQMATRALLEGTDPGSSLSLATGYLNLTDEYVDLLVKSKATYRVLTASPQANGFLGARGAAGHVPYAYIHIAKWFYEQMSCSESLDRISLEEFSRDQWTFHCKGLWYYLPGSELPDMTLIGSSNFGHRSVSRDLEMQFGIVTKNETLRESLAKEHNHLFSYAEVLDSNTFQRDDRRVHWLQALVTRAIWSFL